MSYEEQCREIFIIIFTVIILLLIFYLYRNDEYKMSEIASLIASAFIMFGYSIMCKYYQT